MVSMGQGSVYLMMANIVLMGSGYLIHVGLGRFLGPEDYGIFGVVIAFLTFLSIALRMGIPQAISKYIAEDNKNSDIIILRGIKVQFIFIVIIFLLYYFLSDYIALALGDMGLESYIEISSIAIITFGIFALYLNIMNGFRLYGNQARMVSVYSLAKVVGIFTLVALGFGVYGAIAGFVLAPLAGAILGMHYFRIRFKDISGYFDIKRLVFFAAPITLFFVGYNLLGFLDLLIVKRLLSENIYAGFYTASNTIARIPGVLFLGVSSALFPAISGSVARKDEPLTANYIRGSLRYTLMLIVPGVFIVSATSESLVSLLYSTKYLPASEPLQILIFGWGFLPVFHLLATVLNGGGHPKISSYIVVIALTLSFAMNFLLIPKYGMVGAAIATTSAGVLAVLLALFVTKRIYNTLVEGISILKIVASSILIYIIAGKIALHYYFLPLEYIMLFGLYLLLLVLIKEFTAEDYRTFKKLISREKTEN